MSELEHQIFLHSDKQNFSKSHFIKHKNLPKKKSKKEIYVGLDLLKGFLLILVITYHAMGGPIHESELAFWILTFTMPLFSSLSGFLINEDFIKESSYIEVFMKYWHRMIKDWLMVWVLMYAIDIIMGLKEASFVSFLYYLIFPTYHLWYIPALFLYVSFFWVMKHYDINDHVILGTAIVFSMVYGLIGEYIIAPVSHDVQYSIGWGIYYSLKPHYGGFFILGWYLRKHILDKKHQIMKFVNFVLWIAFGVLLVARINRSLDFKAFYSFDFYILNYAAIILFFPIIRHVVLHKNLIINEFLQMISDYSLYIYLYHGILVYVRYI